MAPRKSKGKGKGRGRGRPRKSSGMSSAMAPVSAVLDSEVHDNGVTVRKIFMGVLIVLFVAGVSYLIYDRVNNKDDDSTPAPQVGGGGGTSSPGTSPTPTPTPNPCTMERVTSGGQVDEQNSTKVFIVPVDQSPNTVGCSYESQKCSAMLGEGEETCKSLCAGSSECQYVRFTGDGVKCTFYGDVVQSGSGAPSEPLFKKGALCA